MNKTKTCECIEELERLGFVLSDYLHPDHYFFPATKKNRSPIKIEYCPICGEKINKA